MDGNVFSLHGNENSEIVKKAQSEVGTTSVAVLFKKDKDYRIDVSNDLTITDLMFMREVIDRLIRLSLGYDHSH